MGRHAISTWKKLKKEAENTKMSQALEMMCVYVVLLFWTSYLLLRSKTNVHWLLSNTEKTKFRELKGGLESEKEKNGCVTWVWVRNKQRRPSKSEIKGGLCAIILCAWMLVACVCVCLYACVMLVSGVIQCIGFDWAIFQQKRKLVSNTINTRIVLAKTVYI